MVRRLRHSAEKLLINASFNRLRKFENRHAGETCYIFGDGPSLKWFDLKEFRNHISICCGMLPYHKDFKVLDLRYCLNVEPWLFCPAWVQQLKNPYLKNFKNLVNLYRRTVNEYPEKNFFVSLSNYFFLSGKNINYVFKKLPESGENKLLNQFNLFEGSFHASLALASYLGFSKIYLIGFDAWTIQPARSLHWYERGNGELFEPTNFARDFLDIIKSKVELYTISAAGSSCNVENIPYELYTGKKPQYQENDELLDRHYLDVLSTVSDYKIFKDEEKLLS